MQALFFILIALLPVLAIVAGLALFLPRRGRGADAGNGLSVPLTVAFGSLRAAGPFAGTHNNLNPLLVLGDDTITYRVIRKTTAAYADLATVDAAAGPHSADIILSFRDRPSTFTGRTRDRAALAAALKLLRGKGCALTAAATAIADAPA
jgi:hypothetical protein